MPSNTASPRAPGCAWWGPIDPINPHPSLKEMTMQDVLSALSVKQCDLGRAAKISRSAISRLVINNTWPKRDRATAHRRIADYLARHGATQEHLAVVAQAVAQADAAERKAAPESCELAEADTPAEQSNEPQEDFMLLRNETLSAKAREHFGLHRSPFVDDIRSRGDVFASQGARLARAALMDCALNHGFLAVIAESGAGKTTLREELEQRIADENKPVAIIKPYVLEMESNDQRGRAMKSGQIAEAIITTLAPSVTMKSSAQARAKQAHDLLAASAAAGYSNLLIIEEAHRLPMTTIKHLKGFMELKRGLTRLLGVALIGQPELTKLLSEQSAEVREIVQRCERVEVRPLDNELEAYLKHKFARIDAQLGDVLADDAVDAIRARLVRIPRGGKASDGISMCHPLVVNNLVCRAMNAAAAVSYPRVDAQVIAGC
jgi:type II secretory pathway predicted ATPase ExeA